MQTAESVCLWNYQFRNSSLSNKLSSIDNTPYLACTERLKCQNESSSKAIFYCVQCSSLQCVECEQEIHQKATTTNHERLKLDEIEDERCSVDQTHQAALYCTTCASSFCYSCYENQHQHADGHKHNIQKCRDGKRITTKKNNDQHRTETQLINNSASSDLNNELVEPTSLSFENIHVDYNEDNSLLSSNEKETRMKIVAHQTPKQHNFNQEMLLESMMDDTDNTHGDTPHAKRISSRLTQPNQCDLNSTKEFLLIDSNEQLTINNELEFLQRLKCDKNLSVKCVTITGNMGDGKSYTLNQVFFNGQEVFHTSSTAGSCTMGIWAALDNQQNTLVFDTEGRLGLVDNDDRRNRLLLKVLCISDVIIYRTRASKLSNDIFEYLSTISNAFTKYFRMELEHIIRNSNTNNSTSIVGPTLIIFHETQHTDILRDDPESNKTTVQQLNERFEAMKLSYDAFSSIEYVGIQTSGNEASNFNQLKATVTTTLEQNHRRPQRRLTVIFKTLKALNEKFNHKISPSIPSALPDDVFACSARCLSCRMKCTMMANHERDNLPHSCENTCLYDKEFDNEVWKCSRCYREGRDTTVYGKLVTKNDGLVQGLLKYVWSGCVIECPYHGEIYRSRKHWYGNNEPKDVTSIETIHIWPNDDHSRLSSDVTPRKFVELLVYASSYLSAPTKLLSEMVADQVAPSYWIPNKYVIACSSCKLHFGSEFSKHHCRACGYVFCDTCTSYRRIVPWIDSQTPVRVCINCNDDPKPPSSSLPETHKPLSQKFYENGSSDDSASTTSSGEKLTDLCLTPIDIFDIEQAGAGTAIADIPASRRVYETVKSGLEKLGVNYPIELIKESTRPSYWKPDNECHDCCVCKRMFNNTTNRLHHCRCCGEGVCENCSPHQYAVPERDWLTPVRVCRICEKLLNTTKSKA